MTNANLKDFRKKLYFKNDTMNESELQRFFNYPVYPRGSKICSDKMCVNIDNGQMGSSHETAFSVKNNKSFYFDSFGGAPRNFSRNQIPKTNQIS